MIVSQDKLPIGTSRTSPRSVAIIHHPMTRKREIPNYLISILAERWKDEGVEVVHLRGATGPVEADAAVLHVDLSVVPRKFVKTASRFPVAINANVLDIRKRLFSTLAVTESTDYRGPVIVKTNLNAGGNQERRLRRHNKGGLRGKLLRVAEFFAEARETAPHVERICSPETYEVYPTPSLVPREIYRDRNMIVERFVPEQRGDAYHHRRYYFLGEAEVNQVWVGTSPICARDSDGWPEDAPLPEELRAFRRRLGINFGKIDYVIRPQGEVVVLDVNKTPKGFCPDPLDRPWLEDLSERLYRGIFDLSSFGP